MRIKTLVMVGLLCGAPCALAEVVSFEALEKQLSQGNLANLKAQASIRSSEATLAGAKWQYAPELALRSAKSWTKVPDEDKWPVGSVRHSLVLSWTVFDGFTRSRSIDTAEAQKEGSYADLSIARVESHTALASAYLDWQAATERLAIQEDIVRLRERNFKGVRNRVNRGELDRQESLQFENQLLEARDQLLQAQANLQQAIRKIGLVLPGAKLNVTQHRPVEKALFSQDFCRNGKDELRNHPRIRSLQARETIAELRRDDVNSDYYPTLDVEAEQALNQWDSANTGPNTTTLSLRASWDLTAGISGHYRKAAFESKRIETEIQVRQAVDALMEQYDQNCIRLKTLDQRLRNAANIVGNYKRLYESGERKFASAGLSSLDLIRLQSDYLAARLKKVQTTYDRQKILQTQQALFRFR